MDLWTKLQPRLDDLRGYANDDGIDYDRDSERALEGFLARNEITARPAVFLTDQGLLRALWRRDDEQVVITFLGQISMRYTIIAKNGRCVESGGDFGLQQAIDKYGVTHLLSAAVP